MKKVERVFETVAKSWIVVMILILIYSYFDLEIGFQLIILGLFYAIIHAITNLIYKTIIKR
jgi:hypothetical protein